MSQSGVPVISQIAQVFSPPPLPTPKMLPPPDVEAAKAKARQEQIDASKGGRASTLLSGSSGTGDNDASTLISTAGRTLLGS